MVKEKAKKKGRNKDQTKSKKAKVPVKRSILSTVLEKAKENKEAIKYVALFLVFCAAFFLVYHFVTVSGSMVMVHVRNITALILGTILSFFGMDVVVNGTSLSVNNFPLIIVDECTAVFSSIVYCSCVSAYPTTLRNKCLGIAFGVPLLYAINILRLVVLALVGVHNPNLFEFVHVYLWQASFIIFVVVIFLLWLKFMEKGSASKFFQRK